MPRPVQVSRRPGCTRRRSAWRGAGRNTIPSSRHRGNRTHRLGRNGICADPAAVVIAARARSFALPEWFGNGGERGLACGIDADQLTAAIEKMPAVGALLDDGERVATA